MTADPHTGPGEVPPSIGLAHDYLLVMRGAERTFAAMADCWPEAPIHTLLYDEKGTQGWFAGREIATSYLQRLNVDQDRFRRLLPLFPHATSHLDTTGFDLLISSSSAFAHGVRKAPGATHVCYCYTPFRYAWYEQERALGEVPRPARPALSLMLRRMRAWDRSVSRDVDHYIGISELSRERIGRYLGRDATVIHPPVDVERFTVGAPEDYLLIVCEITPHKRVDVAVEAARIARLPIKVVGSGPDLARLQAQYAGTAEFLGRVDDPELADLYRSALAVVIPNVEEFGITAVEAQASGRPVVATAAGGALETVVDGETGVLVPGGGTEAFAEALRETDFRAFSPERATAQAQRFSRKTFQRKLSDEVARVQAASGRA